MKQRRAEEKYQKSSTEIWLELLEKLALENTGADAGELSPSVQITLNKVSLRRYGKNNCTE
ncbi:hypothetical protein KB553_11520 [Chryseobacterium rhizoplanae]|uniref:hypothetical protein n=1 Tax=Chryseobacterium rhizoplanae TaxID=1609531 RepID=UPI001CE2D673|nr:hypothetical protein [Chryseobacterium rhizoplanae]UCA62121.1 hypothetical protein KB553_11520 [Chryseobacterium rhizoplanae]